MSFAESVKFFDGNKNIPQKLQLSCDLDLGYIQLGQPMNTLSGGEIQRIKLVREMTRCRGKKDLLYIFDEPTNDLDSKNANYILEEIQSLKQNAIVIVVSHDDRVIDKADRLVKFEKVKDNLVEVVEI